MGDLEAVTHRDAFLSLFAQVSYKNVLAEVKATWPNCSPQFTLLQPMDLGS